MTLNKTQLRPLVSWRDEVTLVPFSGIQIFDFGFRFDDLPTRPAGFIERVLGADTASAEADEASKERILIPLSGDKEVDAEIEAAGRFDDDLYSIRPEAALEPFLEKWVPVPVLRLKSERGAAGEERYDPGPSSWARMRTVELETPDPETGHTHRVQLAIDTTLIAEAQERHYVAPERADAEEPRDFRLVANPAHMDWFLRRLERDVDGNVLDLQHWVSDWLKEIFLAFMRNANPGKQVSESTLKHLFEHWARYLAYLKLVEGAVKPPRMRFVNTITKRDATTPVDVDLVLDVGNSRTCGILIERFPSESRVDLVRSFPLEIRDLSRPELHYSGLFESRVEFAEQKFGDDRYSSRSGRRTAFMWPGFVRVGPEALRLVQGEEGTETASGLSSPKRYLWDSDVRQQDWRFHNHFDPNNLPKSVRAAMRHLNEAGDVIEQVRHEEDRRLRARGRISVNRAIRPRFSRSSLFGFMLAELFSHALVQVNDPASRARRAQSDLPRRLNRIILTLPTATTAQEQAIMRSRAEGALRLVWAVLGADETETTISQRPELIVQWDEASCTQLVYLYSELTQKFDGRIDSFLTLKGQPRLRPGASEPAPSLRLACIDIGGGTTDLMVTTYWGEANRVLHPQQTFREGFRVAGDDLVQRVIGSIILPRLQESIQAAGGRFVAEKMRDLFGGDIGGRDQQLVQKRRQFSLRVLMPLAVAVLGHSENATEFERFDLYVGSSLGLAPGEGTAARGSGAGDPIPEQVLNYIEGAAREVGASDWRLADVVLPISREDVDAIAREVFQKVLGNMAEVLDHLGVDILLLTGRPSRLPAVRAILEEMLVIPPQRLISMHRYRTGRWYPFRDPVSQRIGDPKSTVAVGGMLIALSENRIPNFKVSTSAFQMASTARYVGEMDTSGQILDERVMFADVNLDQKSGGATSKTISMFSPIHIGSRQLPLERWTTTPLYRLDFANAAAQRRPTPIKVTFERSDFDDGDANDSSEEKLRREALREAFVITDVEDGVGDPMKKTDVSLALHTLGFDDDYWIDAGVFQY
ncbi:virulence factor SrfB [Devosia sp. Root635]|uniref:virulence factor SrfB n=1 Tax=Devosia sp. Root635 TaxID=1736575 RepID=UPI0006F708E7|nr:virulence factor SrfB [Devosia sp. Root635]KRA52996.1 virulence factor SrfB [Devosia sp. Root635]